MFPLLVVALTSLSSVSSSSTVTASNSMKCPPCGSTLVPYPLSTRPDCGDQAYKVRCTAGMLWFDAVNGSSYLIKCIDPEKQKMVIHSPRFIQKNACISADLFPSNGIILNKTLPFNITSANTFMLFNCTWDMLQSIMDCSQTILNPCQVYLKYNPNVAACKTTSTPICCKYQSGGFTTAYGTISVKPEQCSAYLGFVNLNPDVAVGKWPEPGVEILWAMPKEPLCDSPVDCRKLPDSSCLPDRSVNGGQKRCLCNAHHHWDAVEGLCTKHLKCRERSCKLRRRRKALIQGFLFTAGATLLGVISILMFRLKHKKLEREAHESLKRTREEILNASNSSGKMAKVYTGKEIRKATNNFSQLNLLGAGGFGEVFKATFDDGTVAAIKRAKVGSSKGVDRILNEVRILCQVNHRSLVKILGCCVDLEDPLLMYEFIPNGTLYDHLHDGYFSRSPQLNWRSRLRIAHQTAEAIAYLHSSAVIPIYHRDIKSSNILLDENFNAKVSDFGLSRLGITAGETHITTCAQGTLGYLDPEYYLNFQLTDKSDVYSFGVVLLELLTSKKVIDFNRREEEVNLVVHMKKILKNERLMDAVDPALKNKAADVDLESMRALGNFAAACLEDHRQNRPSMKDASDEIEYILNVVTNGNP